MTWRAPSHHPCATSHSCRSSWPSWSTASISGCNSSSFWASASLGGVFGAANAGADSSHCYCTGYASGCRGSLSEEGDRIDQSFIAISADFIFAQVGLGSSCDGAWPETGSGDLHASCPSRGQRNAFAKNSRRRHCPLVESKVSSESKLGTGMNSGKVHKIFPRYFVRSLPRRKEVFAEDF